MSTHTPGPWTVEDDGDPCIVPTEDLNDGFIVAKLFGPDAGANAHLIAAAPEQRAEITRLRALNAEILAVLHAIRTELDQTADVDDGIPNEAMKVLVAIDAAFTKAGGKL